LSRRIGAAGGIVRPARRPSGWEAQGPRPRGASGDPDLEPRVGEDLCYLAGDWRIFQRLDGHRWSLDDLATAHYAARAIEERARAGFSGGAPVQKPEAFVDLGCGIGAVLLLLAWRFPAAHGVGIEAQAVSVALARRSVRWNGAAERMALIEGDLRSAPSCVGSATFDLVTGTPPYLPAGTASESERIQRGPCRIEHRGAIEDYCIAARGLLTPGGRFVVCAGGPGGERGEAAGRAAGLALERCRPVVPRSGKSPLFWLYSFALDGSADATAVEPALVVRDARGRRTDEFAALRSDMGMPP
jgi:tRNA1(Val) A37 N6-methylase TrmN6